MNQLAHYLMGMLVGQMIWIYFSEEWAEKHEWSNNIAFCLGKKYQIRKISIIRAVSTLVLAFFSHNFIDALGRFTYHSAASSSIWAKIFGPTIYVLGLMLLLWAIKKDFRYFWGALGGNLMDLWDWHTIRPLEVVLGKDFNMPTLHETITPFNFLTDWGPNLNEVLWAAWVEIIFSILAFILWYKLDKKPSMKPNKNEKNLRFLKIVVIILWALWIAAYTLGE